MARNGIVSWLIAAAALAGCSGRDRPPSGPSRPEAAAPASARHSRSPAPPPAPPSPAPEDRRITFAAEDQEIWRVVARIAELAEANVTCDPEHVRGRVTVNFVDVPWRKALESLAHQGGCVVAEGPGGVVQVLSLERSYGVEEPVRRR